MHTKQEPDLSVGTQAKKKIEMFLSYMIDHLLGWLNDSVHGY
jgi:hypothetical protein